MYFSHVFLLDFKSTWQDSDDDYPVNLFVREVRTTVVRVRWNGRKLDV